MNFWKVSQDQLDAAKTGQPSETSMAVIDATIRAAEEDSKKQTELFEFVRSTYFPEWDIAREWSVGRRRWSYPEVDREKMQVIGIEGFYQPRRMIHRICHAIADDDKHGEGWGTEMVNVARRAADLGDAKLAEEVRNEFATEQKKDEAAKITADVRNSPE
jgi:hypothetical protein